MTSSKKTLTVFTPTYNRRTLLQRTYKSLCRQTSRDFKWIVIDDGSTDDTALAVQKWQMEKPGFDIIYRYKKNGGHLSGFNAAIELLDSELAVCIDSDDYMPDDAVEKIVRFWKENGSDKYAGMVGLDYQIDGTLVGKPLPPVQSICVPRATLRDEICGDKKYIARSELFKQVAPIELYPGEKYFNPFILFLLIGDKYEYLVLNENICIVEYQPDGLSKNKMAQYKNSPNSFADRREWAISCRYIPRKRKLVEYVHYISSCLLARRRPKVKFTDVLYFVLALGPGVVLYFLVKYGKH